jgi:hypothetical protein
LGHPAPKRHLKLLLAVVLSLVSLLMFVRWWRVSSVVV